MKYHLLFNGLGAGNIGDEAMMQGFLSLFPEADKASVEVWDNTSPIVKRFPSRHNYVNYQDEDTVNKLCLSADAVLLVGDTPVMEKWGLDWPLRALSPRLEFCHRNGIPCHAVGVGADLLEGAEARGLFEKGFLPVSSWSVRSLRSRRNLIALGVDSKRIRVAADLAWLTPLDGLNKKWAVDFLDSLGIKMDIPLLGVNVINEIWKDNHVIKKEIAKALDAIIGSEGWQAAFFCNETREGDYYDKEASLQVISHMKNKAVLVPNNYFTPQEMVSLISCCHITLSWRYHFTLFSYLAGTVPVSVIRGEKMLELIEETGGEHLNSHEDIKSDEIVGIIRNLHGSIDGIRACHETVTDIMRLRSRVNFYPEGCRSGAPVQDVRPAYRLASVEELNSEGFRAFMKAVNLFAKRAGLKEFSDWSKVWEYPWLWFNCLSGIDWTKTRLLDIGSELSPMPWFLASLGASVTLVESDPQWIPVWEQIQRETGLNPDWQIVKSEILPFADSSFDVVASFSVIEHQPDKLQALNEAARVLKPGGLFALSFDLSEPDMGMTFPDWNGKALTMKEFEDLVWHHPHFDNMGQAPEWNTEDIPEFINWHLQSAPHHNYIAGAGILKKKLIVPENIRKILLPRFDTIGDIVLLEGFLEALIEKFPQAEIVLLVREGYDQLASLFPEKLRWMTTSINPYKNVDEKCLKKLTELSGEIAGISCGLLLTTTYNRTWLDDVVAAMVPDALRIALGEEEETGRVRGFLKILGTEVQRLYNKIVPVDEHLHETEKYQILWDALFKDDIKLSLPRLNIAKEIENKTLTILADAGLEDKKFFVCVPAGNQNIPAKVWPAEYFAEAVFWITREFGLRPLIVCHESETAIVSALSEKLEEKGVGFHTWIGKDGELPILAGLMKKACFYLGNDTGPMHIAAAAGTPVAGIFGGGTWPRFLPLGPHSIGLAGELPCFGCYWDCIFGDAPCIRLVTVYDVQKAIRRILKEDRVETNRMYASTNISKETMQYIEKAAAIFKMFKAGSAARLHKSEANSAARLEAILERDRKLQESEANSAARLEVILERDRKLQESEANSAARLEVILERDRKLQAMDQALQESKEHVQKLLKTTALLPLVSVVTPVFNGARWIESCIKSVMQQDYPRIEHIVVDACSTDSTLDICRKYPHLIVHSKKDRGQSHAINKGFAMARGEILAWLCADDEYEAGAVEAAVKGILSGHKVVMGYSRFIDAEGNVISEHPANAFPYYNHDMFLRFWQYNPLSQPAIFWTRGMWETCGPLRETLYFAMDYDLWLRMSLKTRFERVDAYLAKYRIHADAKCFADNYGSRIELINVSRQYWPSIWKTDYWRLLLNYKTSAGPITQHYADAEKLLNSAAACLNNGKRFSAVTAFVRAHLRHFAAPQMPGYSLIFKRILGEGIGQVWLWGLMKKTYERIKLKMSKYSE